MKGAPDRAPPPSFSIRRQNPLPPPPPLPPPLDPPPPDPDPEELGLDDMVLDAVVESVPMREEKCDARKCPPWLPLYQPGGSFTMSSKAFAQRSSSPKAIAWGR